MEENGKKEYIGKWGIAKNIKGEVLLYGRITAIERESLGGKYILALMEDVAILRRCYYMDGVAIHIHKKEIYDDQNLVEVLALL